MPLPELYREYGREEATLCFGPKSESRALEDGEWVLFPKAALCFSVMGASKRSSALAGARRFTWVAPRASRSAPDQYSGVPLEIRAGTQHELHLFLKSVGQEKYVYVGELGPAHAYGVSGPGSFGEADLELKQALPTPLWQRLTGKPPPGDPQCLDEALEQLRRPTSPSQRLEVVSAIVAYWLGPLSAKDAWASKDLPKGRIPESLRQWLSIVGRREEIFSWNNAVIPTKPESLGEKKSDGKILVFTENQGVYSWATVPEGQDPPVWGRLNGDDEEWSEVSASLSEFLIGATLFEMIMHAPYGGTASWLPQKGVDRIAEVLPPLPLRPWAWPADPGRFYGSRGAFMFASPNGESDGVPGYSVWVGSMTAEAVAFLKDIADDAWESTAL